MKLVVIAGPQSSGKTTSLNYLRKKYRQKLDFHPEINQNTLFPSAKMGSVAVTPEMEREIVQADIQYIHDIAPSSHLQLAETSLFHLVYGQHLDPEFYQEAKSGYQQALDSHDLYIIFIDTPPEISFSRREQIYLQRIEDKIREDHLSLAEAQEYTHEMMAKYQRRIDDLYPIWHQVLDEVNYAKKKIVIPNNHSNQDQFLQEIDSAFLNLLNL